MVEPEKKLVFLGVGQVARALAARAANEFKLYGTTRSAERAEEISSLGIEPIVFEGFESGKLESVSAVLDPLIDGANVVVSFPPDVQSDVSASHIAARAAGIVYVSSTAVYGKAEGLVNETTKVDEDNPQAQLRLQAERNWLEVGASVIRAPGIYGRGSGLHNRLMSGQYRLPGDGSNFVSRIHVDDLSAMILSALVLKQRKQIFLAGDARPTTHREIVEWLCHRLNLPFPESVPIEQCHYTQRGNRKVDATASLLKLGAVLQYPTYAEGYAYELEAATPLS